MANENAFLDENQWNSDNILYSFDFDDLEEELQNQLEEETSKMVRLQRIIQKLIIKNVMMIGSPIL